MIKQKKFLEHIIHTKCFLSPVKEQRGKQSFSVFAHQEQKAEQERSILESPTPINQLLTKTCVGVSTRSTLDCILRVFFNVRPNDWDCCMLSVRVVETEEFTEIVWLSILCHLLSYVVICYLTYVKLTDMCWVEHEEHTGLHPQSVFQCFQLHNVLRLDRTCSLNPESGLNHTDWQHISVNHLASNWHHNFSPRLAAMCLFLLWYAVFPLEFFSGPVVPTEKTLNRRDAKYSNNKHLH